MPNSSHSRSPHRSKDCEEECQDNAMSTDEKEATTMDKLSTNRIAGENITRNVYINQDCTPNFFAKNNNSLKTKVTPQVDSKDFKIIYAEVVDEIPEGAEIMDSQDIMPVQMVECSETQALIDKERASRSTSAESSGVAKRINAVIADNRSMLKNSVVNYPGRSTNDQLTNILNNDMKVDDSDDEEASDCIEGGSDDGYDGGSDGPYVCASSEAYKDTCEGGSDSEFPILCIDETLPDERPSTSAGYSSSGSIPITSRSTSNALTSTLRSNSKPTTPRSINRSSTTRAIKRSSSRPSISRSMQSSGYICRPSSRGPTARPTTPGSISRPSTSGSIPIQRSPNSAFTIPIPSSPGSVIYISSSGSSDSRGGTFSNNADLNLSNISIDVEPGMSVRMLTDVSVPGIDPIVPGTVVEPPDGDIPKVKYTKAGRILNKNRLKLKIPPKMQTRTQLPDYDDKIIDKDLSSGEPRSSSSMELSDNGDGYSCDQCTRKFDDLKLYEMHLLKHDKTRPNICCCCFIGFPNRNMFSTHCESNTHRANEKKFDFSTKMKYEMV